MKQWTKHDQEMMEFYSNFISPGALCFDVGANVGNRVKIFLSLGARVVAIEPQEQCVKVLRNLYGENRRLTLVEKALGARQGQAEIKVANDDVISSMSPEWINAVRKSGRFSNYRWDAGRTVDVTTLDRLIEEYGIPAFVKIDVEGFEYEVVKGLSSSVKALSLEFTPEFLDSTYNCLGYLGRLGKITLNYSLGESMQLALDKWVRADEMIGILSRFKADYRIFGDVYVRFNEPNLISQWRIRSLHGLHTVFIDRMKSLRSLNRFVK
jgi:FkbM family methyltransferase